MRPSRIDQVVPSFGSRDAIGTHILHLRDLLQDLGFASDIWCRGAFPDTRSLARFTDDLAPRLRSDTWWLYHLSSGSPVAELIARRPEPKMIDYHNVTPARLFGNWLPWATEEAESGLRQLGMLARASFFGFADSGFNADELHRAGMSQAETVVAAPLFDPNALRSRVDRAVAARRRTERHEGGTDWLFVGRITPSKAQQDLIKALAAYRQIHDPVARLHLVGTPMGEDYPRALERYARRLGLGDAVRLTGPVGDDALAAYYSTSDVFVCASEHEGFCVPVVEAMSFGLPVVAYAAGAVPETAGTGALVVEDKSPVALALAVSRVVSDSSLHGRLVEMGRRRAMEFTLTRGRERWAAAIEMAIESAGDEGSRPAAGSA